MLKWKIWVLYLLASLHFAVPFVAQGEETTPNEIAELRAAIKKLQERRLECTEGKSVQGLVDAWTPYSTCPDTYTVTGLARVDIQGKHEVPTNHVNDFTCTDKGCRAWCIGNACTVQARCCRLP